MGTGKPGKKISVKSQIKDNCWDGNKSIGHSKKELFLYFDFLTIS